MSMLDTLKKNLTPEQYTAIMDALGDDFDWDMVPRSRLNTVIKQRNDARTQLKQFTGEGDPAEPGEPGAGTSKGGAPTAGTFTQADLDNAVQKAKDEAAAALVATRKQFAVTEKLRESKFVDPSLVISANLIDLSKVTMDDNGVVTGGLDDQITALTASKPYLVNAGSSGAKGTGKQGGTDEFGSITSKEEFLKLPTAKQIEFKNANPDVFKGFLNG